MTKEEAQAKAEAFEQKLEEVNLAIEKAATKEEIEAVSKSFNEFKEEFKGLDKTEEIKELKKSLKEQGEALTAMKTNKSKGGVKNFQTALKEGLEKAIPELKELKKSENNRGKEVVITVKAPVTMTTGAVGNADGVDTPDSYVYNQVTDYASDVRQDAYILNFIDNGNTNKPSLPYMDKLPTEGTMAITEEGELKPLISVSFELRYSQAEKIAGRTKISEEALDDIPNLMAIINNELRYEHDMAEQDFVHSKISSVAGAFVAGDMAASTDSPSNYDVVRAAIYSVKIASKGKYVPNAVLIHSADAYNMGAIKDTSGQYILPRFVMPDGSTIAGVRVIETTDDDNVPAGTFIVGDFRKLKRRVYKSFTVRVGQGIVGSGTADEIVSDFESNMYTVIGESRQHLYVYENEKAAFMKSTFAAVKTAIETVEA